MILSLKVEGVPAPDLSSLHAAITGLTRQLYGSDLIHVAPVIVGSKLEDSDDPTGVAKYTVELVLTPRSGVGGREVIAPESHVTVLFKALGIFPPFPKPD